VEEIQPWQLVQEMTEPCKLDNLLVLQQEVLLMVE
jgi:hypothetical protein